MKTGSGKKHMCSCKTCPPWLCDILANSDAPVDLVPYGVHGVHGAADVNRGLSSVTVAESAKIKIL
jgi:hypothetical protein